MNEIFQFPRLAEFGKEQFKKYPYTEYMNELRIDDEVYALVGYVSIIRELLNKSLDAVEQLGKGYRDLIDEFNALKKWVEEEGLEEKVVLVLNEWFENGKLAEIINMQLLNLPFRNVNELSRLAPEINDTGRVQRMIDQMDKGVLVFDGDYLLGDITGKGKIEYVATKGTTVKFIENAKGFSFVRQHDWSFRGFEFDGSQQLQSDCYFVKGFQCDRVQFENNILKNGAFGFSLEETKDSWMDKNIATGFRQWAMLVYGYENFAFRGNISNSGAYDGLKCAGVEEDVVGKIHKNLIVSGNICLFNARDGFDMAGNNIDGAKIHDNMFSNNGVNGIDFKMVYQGYYMRNIEIYRNTCLLNTTHQTNIQVNLQQTIAENIYVEDNIFESAGITGGSAGLRLYGLKQRVFVRRNKIRLGQFGVRVLDSSGVLLEDNDISKSGIGVEVSLQVYTEMLDVKLYRNRIHTNSNPVRITSAGVKNTVVDENEMSAELETFTISDLGTGTVYGRNYGKPVSEKPVGRGTQGEVRKNTSLGLGKPMEWVSLNTNGNAQWVPVGTVENRAVSMITDFVVPAIPAKGVVVVDYQQIPCELGDILDMFPVEALSTNAVSWNIYIAGTNRIRCIFNNTADVEITISDSDWKVVVEKR